MPKKEKQVERIRKRSRLPIRFIDQVKNTTNLFVAEIMERAEDRDVWRHITRGVP